MSLPHNESRSHQSTIVISVIFARYRFRARRTERRAPNCRSQRESIAFVVKRRKKMSKHHSHEISEHPQVQWALELLKPDPTYEPSIVTKYSPEVACMGFAFAVPCVTNAVYKKPFYAGIQRHIYFVAVGYVVSQIAKKLVDNYQAERDTRLRDYIIRHPDLFPEPERIKYNQVLEEWVPIR